MKDQKIKITLPHSINYLPISLSAVHIIAKLKGFNQNDIIKLETATEEVVSNVINFAFNKSEESTFEVIVQIQTMGLLIIVKENVLAVAPKQENTKPLVIAKSKHEHKGLSGALIKRLMDKVWMHSLGKDGQEVHLFKYLENYNLHIKNSAGSKTIEKENNKPLSEKSVNYEVRRMKPKEAIDVSKVAYNSYGNTYLHTDVYYPDRVRELNRTNQLISFIAITEYGEVIAHVAFEKSADVGIPEIGVAFTKPKYRGVGCFNKLISFSLTEGKALGFTGIFAQGVTSHPYSQKALNRFGFLDCALLLSSFHELAFNKIEQTKPQRESVMISFRYLRLPEKMTIYPPTHHAEMIANLYHHIGFHPEIGLSKTSTTPDADKSAITIKIDHDNNTANVTIRTYGKNILMEVHQILNSLCHNHTIIYLRIRLTDPLTANYTSGFEKIGFFFAGILPRSKEKDELILQYLNNTSIDFDQLKIASDMGNEILEYVKNSHKQPQ